MRRKKKKAQAFPIGRTFQIVQVNTNPSPGQGLGTVKIVGSGTKVSINRLLQADTKCEKISDAINEVAKAEFDKRFTEEEIEFMGSDPVTAIETEIESLKAQLVLPGTNWHFLQADIAAAKVRLWAAKIRLDKLEGRFRDRVQPLHNLANQWHRNAMLTRVSVDTQVRRHLSL